MSKYDKYEVVIGLEVHAQLNTKSKAFCGDSTTFGANPNTHISPISLAHPGTLPRMNKEQIRKAGWVLFEAKINEELIDQNRQRVFELSAMQGIRPFL